MNCCCMTSGFFFFQLKKSKLDRVRLRPRYKKLFNLINRCRITISNLFYSLFWKKEMITFINFNKGKRRRRQEGNHIRIEQPIWILDHQSNKKNDLL